MKKSILIFALAAVLIVALSATVMYAAGTPVSVVVSAENGETVNLTPTENIFYLPSSADPTKVLFAADADVTYEMGSVSGTLQAGETLDLTPGKTTDARGAECYVATIGAGNVRKKYTFYHDSKLSSIMITTSQGLSFVEKNKNNRDKDAKILILNEKGDVEYSDVDENVTSELKGRGNATWSYYKKPYQIKLGKKTDLFGMGKAKTWILLANYTDQSALHNALAFELSEALEVPYSIDYRYVDLYIDGEYRGLYMICEKVHVDEERVDITDLEKANELANPNQALDSFAVKKVTSGALIDDSILTYYTYCDGMKSPADITGGYIVELDNIRGESEPCRFQTVYGNTYVVKYPEFASKAEMEYIAELFADMEEAIFSATGYNAEGIHYSEYIDMESFAGVYTVQEVMKNWDAYLSSMFFFKDVDVNGKTSKIYMGPIWDLDNTLGNINFNYEFGEDTAYLWAQNGEYSTFARDFAKKLMSHEDFQAVTAAQFDKAYVAVKEYFAENGWFAETVEEIEEAVMMDRTRWKLYDSAKWLLNSGRGKVSVKFVQFKDYGDPNVEDKTTALGFMRYYIMNRIEALVSLIGSGEAPIVEEETTTTMTTTLPTEEQTTAQSATETTTEITVQTTTATASAEITTAEETSAEETPDCTEEIKDEDASLSVAMIVVIAVCVVACAAAVIVISKKNKKS